MRGGGRRILAPSRLMSKLSSEPVLEALYGGPMPFLSFDYFLETLVILTLAIARRLAGLSD